MCVRVCICLFVCLLCLYIIEIILHFFRKFKNAIIYYIVIFSGYDEGILA